MPRKTEIAKDVIQVAVQSGADRTGRIAGVITRAVTDVAGEIGGWCTDVFEMLDAADRAREDEESDEDREA